MASAEKGSNDVDKKFIADYLEKTYGDKVEVNRRANKISSGILPLADTHYVVKGKKVCFIFVYQTEGGTILLIKANEGIVKELKAKHQKVFQSAFPKAKQTWYSVIADDSFKAADIKKLLDELVKAN